MSSSRPTNVSPSLDDLPVELREEILLEVPLRKLRLFYEEIPPLRWLIAPTLYKNVSIGDFSYPKHIDSTNPKFYNVTLKELKQLVSGEINARIQHLQINEVCGDNRYSQKVWRIISESREFFARIPKIDYHGCKFDMCIHFLPVHNLCDVSTHNCKEEYNFLVAISSLTITSLTLEGRITTIPRLQEYLKHFKLSCRQWTNLVFELPRFLELFSIKKVPFNDRLPKGLLKLRIENVFNRALPDRLTELEVDVADSLLTFPSELKKLKIKSIDTLVGVKFPSNLEVLDLTGVGVTSLDGIVFPSLLRELILEGHELESLDNVTFPDLILLDITSRTGTIKSLSRVRFPNLECFKANGQPVEDWSITRLPETLKELRILRMEKPKKLNFPPNLRILEVCSYGDREKYSNLNLPRTLEVLELDRGKSTIIDWNLPKLHSLRISKFSGPIRVPESVVDLSLTYKNRKLRDDIILPPEVKVLEIPYPMREYPTTVTHLKIRHCNVRSFALPANIENIEVVEVNKNNRLRSSLFTLPNSLNRFRAPFDEELEKPSNWDTENESHEVGILERR